MPPSSPSSRTRIGTRWLLRCVFPRGIFDAIDGHRLDCRVTPREAVCRKCGHLRADWHPRSPPLVQLHIRHESLSEVGLRFPIVHRDLLSLMLPHMPEAITRQCESTTGSPRRVGDRYHLVTTPGRLNTYRREPMLMTDPHCANCGALGGWGGAGSYLYLDADRLGRPVLMCDTQGIAVTEELRSKIDRDLKGHDFRWEEVSVFDMPLPYHRIPEDGLGPPDPPPLPPDPKPPSAPRQPKKNRDRRR